MQPGFFIDLLNFPKTVKCNNLIALNSPGGNYSLTYKYVKLPTQQTVIQ